MPETVSVTLGLGGNLGDPINAMASALKALDDREDCRIASVSRLYRTPPWGKTDQALFYNACAVVQTTLLPAELLAVCLGLERGLKRVRAERWGPRTIDIDILTYSDMSIDQLELQVPHPRMTQRGFVLMPLADIAAEMWVADRDVAGWLALADVNGIEVADEDCNWWHKA